jgi:hypothetical protein
MFRARTTAWTLFAACGFALLAPSASAQDLPKRPDTSKVIEYRDTPRGGIPKGDLPKAREAFANFAKYYAEVVAHPAVWKASQDPKVDAPGSIKIPTLEGPEGIFRELDRFLIDPVPSTSRVNQEPADYIRELGAAFDAALKPQIENHQERIVKINSCRLLAHVARTGAPAHYPTITGLIGNANTPTEVKYYLFHAAGALLSANDATELRIRRHSADAKTVGTLVKALEDCITNPSMIVAGLPQKKDEIGSDQLAVIGFVRRQAVKALGQVKFVRVPGPNGAPLYPSYTLVRVAMSDPALVPAPGPAEAAEAAIGLCNMAPLEEQLRGGFKPVKYNADVAVEAITTALVTFAAPRAARADDKTLPWRTYAARIGEAMRNWRPMFDPEYDPFQPAKPHDPKLVPAPVEGLSTEVVPKILAPMDKADFGTKVELPWLRERLGKMQSNPKRNTRLFPDVAETSIDFPAPK